MKPKEKAEDLIRKYYTWGINIEGQTLSWLEAKQCALIAVNEIISSSPSLPILGDSGTYGEDIELSNKYWQQVKREIKNQ